VGDVVDLSFEARYACASSEEAGTVFVDVCVSPAKTYVWGIVMVASGVDTVGAALSERGGMFSMSDVESVGLVAVVSGGP